MNTKLRLLPLVAICVGGLVLISAGAIFVTGVLTSRSIVSDFTTRIIRRSLDGLELALRDNLDAARHQANFIADELLSGGIALNDPDKLEIFIAGSLAAAPQISGVVVADARGAAVRVVRDEGGELLRKRLSGGGISAEISVATIAAANALFDPDTEQVEAVDLGHVLERIKLDLAKESEDEPPRRMAEGNTEAGR